MAKRTRKTEAEDVAVPLQNQPPAVPDEGAGDVVKKSGGGRKRAQAAGSPAAAPVPSAPEAPAVEKPERKPGARRTAAKAKTAPEAAAAGTAAPGDKKTPAAGAKVAPPAPSPSSAAPAKKKPGPAKSDAAAPVAPAEGPATADRSAAPAGPKTEAFRQEGGIPWGPGSAGVPKPGDEPDVVEPDNALPALSWESLPESLRQAARRAGWTDLMPVQAKVVPYFLARRDLMIQSRTGSGKTGAYALPLLERISPASRSCRALIMVPTRELACQVGREISTLAGDTGLRTAVVYGGVGYGPQIDALKGGAQIVVGTPGRILDHLMRGTFRLDDLDIVILDEADRMLSMGFYPDMHKLRSWFPERRRVSGYLLSATFPSYVFRLAGEFLTGQDFLSLSRDRVHITDMDHVMYVVPSMDRDRALVRIIEFENPLSAIVFCNTKAKVHYVSVVLQRFGFNADELSADISQAAREEVLGRLRSGELRFLVATDLAARGIDIPELSHVIMYEVGEDTESYIHRAGRTARAGAGGMAVSLVAGMEEFKIARIAKTYGVNLQKKPLPDENDLAELVTERVSNFLEDDLRARDRLQVERMRRFAPLARSLSENEDLCGLVAMLIDDYYQKSLHGTFVPPPERQPRPSRPPGERGGDGGRHGRHDHRRRR